MRTFILVGLLVGLIYSGDAAWADYLYHCGEIQAGGAIVCLEGVNESRYYIVVYAPGGKRGILWAKVQSKSVKTDGTKIVSTFKGRLFGDEKGDEITLQTVIDLPGPEPLEFETEATYFLNGKRVGADKFLLHDRPPAPPDPAPIT
jgi:hypothetical protein